jgi:hypothetical protein
VILAKPPYRPATTYHNRSHGVPNGIARALALSRQPLTLPEDGGFAASIAKARWTARGAAEPDGSEVSVRHQRAKTRPVGGPSCAGVPNV